MNDFKVSILIKTFDWMSIEYSNGRERHVTIIYRDNGDRLYEGIRSGEITHVNKHGKLSK